MHNPASPASCSVASPAATVVTVKVWVGGPLAARVRFDLPVPPAPVGTATEGLDLVTEIPADLPVFNSAGIVTLTGSVVCPFIWLTAVGATSTHGTADTSTLSIPCTHAPIDMNVMWLFLNPAALMCYSASAPIPTRATLMNMRRMAG